MKHHRNGQVNSTIIVVVVLVVVTATAFWLLRGWRLGSGPPVDAPGPVVDAPGPVVDGPGLLAQLAGCGRHGLSKPAFPWIFTGTPSRNACAAGC